MGHLITPDRAHPALRSACLALLTPLATLAAIEIVLRVVDLRVLRSLLWSCKTAPRLLFKS
jgi:hypothetical protein